MLKKLLNKISEAASKIGLQKLKGFVAKHPIVRLAENFIKAGKEIVSALLDKDPNNAGQVVTILKKYTRKIISEGAELARESVLSFKNAKLAAMVVHLIDAAEELLLILIDENPNNEAQAAKILEKYKGKLIAEPVDIATDKIADLIRQRVDDPVVAEELIGIVQSLDELVKEEDIPLPKADYVSTTTAKS